MMEEDKRGSSKWNQVMYPEVKQKHVEPMKREPTVFKSNPFKREDGGCSVIGFMLAFFITQVAYVWLFMVKAFMTDHKETLIDIGKRQFYNYNRQTKQYDPTPTGIYAELMREPQVK